MHRRAASGEVRGQDNPSGWPNWAPTQPTASSNWRGSLPGWSRSQHGRSDRRGRCHGRARVSRDKTEGEVTMRSSSSDSTPEFLLHLIIEQTPDAIIFADRQGMIQVWNNAAADLFGYPAGEVIGRSLDVIIPEHLRYAHWEGFGRAVASGHTKHGRRALKTRATHMAGHKLYVSLAFSVVNDRDGKVIGAMATARELIEEPQLHHARAAEARQRTGSLVKRQRLGRTRKVQFHDGAS
jgi:PAS domain S-box-containing protein